MYDIECFCTGRKKEVVDPHPFPVEVVSHNFSLPSHVEAHVNTVWELFSREHPETALDDNIHFVRNFSFGEDLKLETHTSPFRYAQFFSRTQGNECFSSLANMHRLIPFSSHACLVTNDNKAIFGIKRNLSGQISGFAGYPKQHEVVSLRGKTYLDVQKSLLRALEKEVAGVTSMIRKVEHVGFSFKNGVIPRVLDSNYLVYLNQDSQTFLKGFVPDFQFNRELHCVDFACDALKAFAVDNVDAFSRHCLGCLHNVIACHFGADHAAHFVEALKEKGVNAKVHTSGELYEIVGAGDRCE